MEETFEEALVAVIEKQHPATLEEAVGNVRSKFRLSDEDVRERVLRLEDEGKIVFEQPESAVPSSLAGYFLSGWAAWYWVIFGLAVVASVLVFSVPEDAFPVVYARNVFGSVFVLFLPGYSLIKALFGNREIDNVERLALSIGLSLALVPIAGLLLNYTPWGIRTAPVTLSLLALTLVFASAAVVRDYETKTVRVLD